MRILEGKKEFHKMIRHAQNIFIVGHQDLDLDALGCALGMYEMLKNKNKHCYLVTNDKKNELGVEKVLAEVRNQLNIISTSQIAEYFHPISRKNLLLILDTNKKNLLPDETLDEQFDHVIVIDHHDESDNSVTKGLIIIDPDASSTCEMVTELIDSTRAILDPIVSTTLLAGIVLDTNNFILKTTAKTYYTAYNLTRLGADPKKVQYLLKQDLKQYIERQKTITNVKVLNQNIALAVGSSELIYRREDLAKIADTLLLFNKIEASFVIGQTGKKTIGISARSMGEIPIQDILEPLGGGGDNYNAACKIEDSTLEKVEQSLKRELQKQRNENE